MRRNEMYKELIERMKKNERPYVLLSEEERKCLLSLPKDTIECLQSTSTADEPEWIVIPIFRGRNSDGMSTYRIKADYQPKPEEKIQLEYGYIYIVHTKAYIAWQIGMYVGDDNIGRYSFLRTDGTKFYIEAGEADFEKVKTDRIYNAVL